MSNYNERLEYPPYACSCCGVTNGDMFWDYIEHNDNTLTYAEVKDLCDEFDSYRAKWHRHNEEVIQAVRDAKKRPRAVRRATMTPTEQDKELKEEQDNE